MKDSLWSMDLFRCESATLRTHWVLVVMDQYTRRIIGFGVHAGKIDGVPLCRMFNRAIRGHRWLSKYLSSDNDPLYRFPQWLYLVNARPFRSRGDKVRHLKQSSLCRALSLVHLLPGANNSLQLATPDRLRLRRSVPLS